MTIRRALFVLLLSVLLLAIVWAAGAQTVIVKAARLIDGRGGPPLAPVMVRINGERIEEVATSLRCRPAQLIDLGADTLLPGLIDLHTHLTSQEGVHWEDALTKTTPAEAALWGARNARVTLMSGVTTFRDMGSTWPYVDVELRKAIDAGAVPGPRMAVAGSYVSSTGGAGDAKQFSTYVDVPSVQNLADGPDEVVKAVRTNFTYGADFIKILATGAVLSKGSLQARSSTPMPRSRQPSPKRNDGAGRWPPMRMARTESRRRFAPACGPSITGPWTRRRSRCMG